jgi:hypothetical protein
MRSQSRETREAQKKSYDQSIQQRRADLEKKGLTPKQIDKDKVYAHLTAKRRAIMNAITAIDASDARNRKREEAPVEQPVAPEPAPSKEKKPKKAKAAPAKAGH